MEDIKETQEETLMAQEAPKAAEPAQEAAPEKAAAPAAEKPRRRPAPAKKVSPEVWDKMENLLESKEPLHVKVDGIVKGGAVAHVDGIRGFIPASKISIGYVENLEDWLGKEIDVQVITADREENRLVLSAKELAIKKREEEKLAKIAACQVGDVVTGVVETIQNYGAFVKLENGATGLLHVSQISDKRIKTPADVLEVGQQVTVKITAVKEGRLSLSIKALKSDSPRESRQSSRSVEYTEKGKASTNLGSLLKDIKLDQ